MKRAALLALIGGLPLLASAQAPGLAPVTRVGLFVERSDLDRGYADWTETTLRVQRLHAPRESTEFALARTSRFGLRDTQLELAHVTPLSPSQTLSLQIGGSPTHRVLPQGFAGVSLQTEFAPGWLLHTAARHTRYDHSRVNRLGLTLERYAGAFSHSLEWAPARALGQRTDVVTWRSAWYPRDGASLGLILSRGDEATELGGGAVALADVRAAALVARWPLAPAWSLTGALGRTRQGDFYTRTAVSLGVQRDF